MLPSLNTGNEERKVAVEKDRWTALLRCLVHLVPLAAAVTLIYLNLAWKYVGETFNPEGITALQFAAKLHEMTMVASLGTVFLSYIRHFLVSDVGIPFGAAFAGLRVRSRLRYSTCFTDQPIGPKPYVPLVARALGIAEIENIWMAIQAEACLAGDPVLRPDGYRWACERCVHDTEKR